MQGAEARVLPCEPEPEPELDTEPTSGKAAWGCAAGPAAVSPLLGAMVEMAKAFSQPPPFSAFGGPPKAAAAQSGDNPWAHEGASSGPAEASVPTPVPVDSCEEAVAGLSHALTEQFGAAVSDLLEDGGDGGSSNAKEGFVSAVPWAVLPSPAAEIGESTTMGPDQVKARPATGDSEIEQSGRD